MDPVASLLGGARARGAFLLRTIQTPPWSVRVRDRAPLSVVAVLAGTPWVVPDTGDAVRLERGDIALLRGPDGFTFTDDPGTPVQVVVEPGPQRRTVSSVESPVGEVTRPRTWVGGTRTGDAGRAPAVLLIGKYRRAGDIAPHLLRVLPSVLVERHGEPELVALLAAETARDVPGQTSVLDRFLDLLLAAVLRAWFARADAPDWLRADGDAVVGSVLRLMHGHPGRPWTVESLARAVGVSRATLARRFTERVGTPPMTYLGGRRIDLAAQLLEQSDATIESIARKVGYGSAFTFSAAFKRAQGISPRRYRDRWRRLWTS